MSSLQPVVNIPAHLKANFRRTIILAIVVGVVALVALVLTGHALLGLFGCLGILLGSVNALLVQRSAVTYGNSENAGIPQKKLLTMSIAGRLLITTLVAVLIGIFFAPNGVAVFGGLLVFQVLMLAGTAVPMMRGMRQ
jgi:ABC-type phosphate/phosphonate transport system permease subunit